MHPQRPIEDRHQNQVKEKLQVKLPEAEVQSFAVALRYMYTDCIFPLVKGEHLSFHRCVKSLENVCVLCANVTKRESRLKFTTKMTLRCGWCPFSVPHWLLILRAKTSNNQLDNVLPGWRIFSALCLFHWIGVGFDYATERSFLTGHFQSVCLSSAPFCSSIHVKDFIIKCFVCLL